MALQPLRFRSIQYILGHDLLKTSWNSVPIVKEMSGHFKICLDSSIFSSAAHNISSKVKQFLKICLFWFFWFQEQSWMKSPFLVCHKRSLSMDPIKWNMCQQNICILTFSKLSTFKNPTDQTHKGGWNPPFMTLNPNAKILCSHFLLIKEGLKTIF